MLVVTGESAMGDRMGVGSTVGGGAERGGLGKSRPVKIWVEDLLCDKDNEGLLSLSKVARLASARILLRSSMLAE